MTDKIKKARQRIEGMTETLRGIGTPTDRETVEALAKNIIAAPMTYYNDAATTLRALLDERDAAEAQLAEAQARPTVAEAKVKPLDLSNLLHHAFIEGFIACEKNVEGLDGQDCWPEYDPTESMAYQRISRALGEGKP